MTHPTWGQDAQGDDRDLYARNESAWDDNAWEEDAWYQSAADQDGHGGERPRRRLRLPHVLSVAAIGMGVAAAVTLVASKGEAWITTEPVVEKADMRLDSGPVVRTYALASASERVGDVTTLPSAGAVAIDPNWILRAPTAGVPGRFVSAMPQTERAPDTRVVLSLPVPAPNPLTATDRPLLGTNMATVPLPLSNPLNRGARVQVASLAPETAPLEVPAESHPTDRLPTTTPAAPPTSSSSVQLPTPGSRFALYDIAGKTVYMPSGERLEAHSGLGEKFDDPRYVAVKMRGPTPPNTYRLTRREALFHGVEALRMHPIGEGKMFGRDGFLTHSYMMGPRGDSNGCISFKDYARFLSAYKRGEVTHLVVVASLPDDVKPAPSLLSWLMPK